MKLKYDEADMHAQLVKVLYPDETAMFPVYCVYNDYCAIIGLNQKDLENQGILA